MNAPALHPFRCVALDAQGQSHEQLVQAASEAHVVQLLAAKGLTPIVLSQRVQALWSCSAVR
jgi:type II secretory pathway component PulF